MEETWFLHFGKVGGERWRDDVSCGTALGVPLKSKVDTALEVRGRDGEQKGSHGTRGPGTYSGDRNLAIDTISSCHFESLRKAHTDAPGFIIRSRHFTCGFT